MNNSSGLIQRTVPAVDMMVADSGIVLRSIKIVMRPKSAIRAVPSSSTRMFACLASQQDRQMGCERSTDPFKISVNDPELVKVGCAGHEPGELRTAKDRKSENSEETADGLTSCKRFASGLDLVYSITFPLCIQSETMRKLRGSTETETPTNGKMLGWDRRFQPMTSRQNRYAQTE